MAPSRKPEHGIDPSSNPGQAGLRAAGPVGSQGTVDLVTVTTVLYASESGQRPAVNLRRWGTVITIVRYQSVIFIIDQLWVAGPLALALLSMYLCMNLSISYVTYICVSTYAPIQSVSEGQY